MAGKVMGSVAGCVRKVRTSLQPIICSCCSSHLLALPCLSRNLNARRRSGPAPIVSKAHRSCLPQGRISKISPNLHSPSFAYRPPQELNGHFPLGALSIK